MKTSNQMKHTKRAFVIAVVLTALLAACGGTPNESGYYFAGYVYDGLSGEVIDDYSLELTFYDITLAASIDSSGRYVVGPLEQGHDFMIRILADGYRPFSSLNSRYSSGRCDNPCVFQSEVFYAYLIPRGVVTPETIFSVYLDDSLERPSGTMLLRPTSDSGFFEEILDYTTSIVQTWENDEDLLNGSVLVPVEEGQAVVPEGELVFGVTYDITVYAIPGYQYTFGETFTAGIDQSGPIIVSRQEGYSLQLVLSTADFGPSENAVVVLVFNQPVIFDPANTTSFYEEVIDDNVSITTDDDDDDGFTNELQLDENDSIQERGTSISLSDDKITLAWSTDGLGHTDADDRIRAVTFGGFDDVIIHPADGQDHSATLRQLVGASVTVTLTP